MHSTSQPFDSLYVPYPSEIAVFGQHWCGPVKYEHMKNVLVAKYQKESRDGQTVHVYCCAAPARFYILKVKAGKNSVGRRQKAWELGTGSSADTMAAQIAEAISGGMLALH